ncbi:EamA family transporter [Microbacterium sp. NRRL B-14842]|uniref:EamA family transporter n=1 Tax=unclassified Microbacterium TaxID=2609290 RepID=UPI0021A475DA|nr:MULTISPECIES: EamA family transporter [unclassified Microbacterium]MCT1365399.1 EamA family transporter [Microbacterium sp. p3-SID131]MCT1375358.1 EamA family transporter [Microbacterium sp. p3-SID337]
MSAVALVLVLAAAIAHASWNVIAHGISRAGSPFLWWGAVASTVVWIGAVPFTGGLGAADLGSFALGVSVSAVLHVAYMAVLQRGYREGSLSTVYATARGTGPFLSVIVAVLLLGERPSALALVGVAAVIVGVVAIGFVDRRPTGSGRRIDPGLLFGALTGVAIAVYTIWDAHAVREWELSPVAFMVGTTLLQVPFYSVAVRGRWGAVVALGRTQWRRILAFGILSPLSYILVLTAIQIAPVALVAPLREVSVVLVSLFGAFVLRESRPGWRIGASLIVLVGIVLLAL